MTKQELKQENDRLKREIEILQYKLEIAELKARVAQLENQRSTFTWPGPPDPLFLQPDRDWDLPRVTCDDTGAFASSWSGDEE